MEGEGRPSRSAFTANQPVFLNMALTEVYDSLRDGALMPGHIRILLEAVNLFTDELVQSMPEWKELDRRFSPLPISNLGWQSRDEKNFAHLEARLHMLQGVMRKHGIIAVTAEEDLGSALPERKVITILDKFPKGG